MLANGIYQHCYFPTPSLVKCPVIVPVVRLGPALSALLVDEDDKKEAEMYTTVKEAS
jgi:hypothetical protein